METLLTGFLACALIILGIMTLLFPNQILQGCLYLLLSLTFFLALLKARKKGVVDTNLSQAIWFRVLCPAGSVVYLFLAVLYLFK